MIALEMDMPGKCEDCPLLYLTEGVYCDYCQWFSFNGEGWRAGEVTRDDIEKQKPDWCPLIEVKQK